MNFLQKIFMPAELKKAMQLFSLSQNAGFQFLGNRKLDIPNFQTDSALIDIYYSIPQVGIVINYLIEQLSKPNIKLIAGTKQKPGKEYESHPLLDLLQNPNPQQSYEDLIKIDWLYYLLTGNSYLYASTSTGYKQPTRLYNLPSQDITINASMINYSIYQIINYQLNIGTPVEFSASSVLHRKQTNISNNQSAFNFVGASPLLSARYPLTSIESAYQAKCNLYKHGPKVILAGNNNSGDGFSAINPKDAKIERDRLNTDYGLTDDQYQIMLTHLPLSVHQIGHNSQQLQISENNTEDLKTIAAIYQTPPVLVGDLSSATFNNLENYINLFWNDVISVKNDAFVAKLNNWLLPMFGLQGKAFIYADYSHIRYMQKDKFISAEKIALLYEKGILTQDEARIEIGYTPASKSDKFFELNQKPAQNGTGIKI